MISTRHVLLASLGIAPAQLRAQNPVHWNATAPAQAVAIGKVAAIRIRGVIADGWHIYSLTQGPGGPVPTRITMPTGQRFHVAGPVGSTTPKVSFDANFAINVEAIAKEAIFTVPVAVDPGARFGRTTFASKCVTRHATPPAVSPQEQRHSALPSWSRARLKRATEPDTEHSDDGCRRIVDFPGGRYRGAQPVDTLRIPHGPDHRQLLHEHASADRRSALRNALLFSGGIIGAFTALGFTLALLVGATGVSRSSTSPWVNLFIAGFFLFFAGNLLGGYQIAIPHRFVATIDRLTRMERSNGILGALLMGVLFTITSFTCTAPFIGTLLVMAARGDWPRPLVGMLVYSIVFSLPFFALAMLPQWLVRLPKSGDWLNSVKVVLGLLEVAAAMKFIANVDLVWHWGVMTRSTVIVLLMVLMAVIALYLLGRIRFPHDMRTARDQRAALRPRCSIGCRRSLARQWVSAAIDSGSWSRSCRPRWTSPPQHRLPGS